MATLFQGIVRILDSYGWATPYQSIGEAAKRVEPSHVNDVDPKTQETLLQQAARIGNLYAVQELLKKGADLRGSRIEGKKTPLFLAALGGYPHVMQELITAQLAKNLDFSHPDSSRAYKGFQIFPFNFVLTNYDTFDVFMNNQELDPNLYSSEYTRYRQAELMIIKYVEGNYLPSTQEAMEARLNFLFKSGMVHPNFRERDPICLLIEAALKSATVDRKILEMLKFLTLKGGLIPRQIYRDQGFITPVDLATKLKLSETKAFLETRVDHFKLTS